MLKSIYDRMDNCRDSFRVLPAGVQDTLNQIMRDIAHELASEAVKDEPKPTKKKAKKKKK